MTEGIVVALIAGAASIGGAGVGAYFSNRKSNALIAYRLEELEKKVDKHNNVIERTYKLEELTALQEEKIRVVNHRISDLEKRDGFIARPEK